ncbi:MAG TPA: type VI secretion system baseplate subunit TssK [Terriglobia bacterium]|jgi:type VI secretion system protein ImpJ|nr:type VI secretion system baseplate subunit TssK [Terriglobia bacterium]
MRHLQPVLWTKGTLLTPQHLQIQDRFLEDTLQFWLQSLAFCPWGFRQLRLDYEALAAGLLSVSAASGIFPDGLLFEIPEADASPAARPLAEHFGPSDTSLDVYLAIPQYRERGLNVSVSGTGADTRYVADAVFVQDEARVGSEKPVQVARKGFRILVEGESRQGYSSLRMARVERSPVGAFQLDGAFVPPVLDLATNEYLLAIARRLFEVLGAKSTELSALRRHKNESLADFTSSEIADFWMLYTINSHYPLVRHIFDVRHGHPEALFSIMAALAGALTTFSRDVHPRDLPVYDHEDLSGCFTAMDTRLRTLLETTVPKNYVALALKQVQPSIYAVSLAEERFFQNTRMYLALRAEMDHGELIGKAPQLVKIGAATHIDHMVRHALPGAQIVHTARPPAGLPVKTHYEYFSLAQSGAVWDSIARARNLAAYLPAEFPNAEMELIILLPQSRS